jgi:hypothetical protein
MKRIIAIAAAGLALAGLSVAYAPASSASACQPNGVGCTKAGTYSGPNAVINSNYTGFKVVWTRSVVQPYSSGVPLYWTAYVTYTNVESSSLTLGCPGSWADASYVAENMSGGSGDNGTVTAESTNCSQNPGQLVTVAPNATFTAFATFHNVPWPGSAVSITWGDAGTTTSVDPFKSPVPPIQLVTTVPNANWVGYSAYPDSGDATGAWGNWIVPKITCTKAYPNARVAVWAGLWGSNESIGKKTAWLPQIGTLSQCVKGAPQYRMIWQMETAVRGGNSGPRDAYTGYAVPSHCAGKLPNFAYYVCGTLPTGIAGGFGEVKVNPGDQVQALVYLDGRDSQAPSERSFSIVLEDFTGANNGKYATGTITTNKIKVPLDDASRQGGIITETGNPPSDGLARFGTLKIGVNAVEQTGGTGSYRFYKWVLYKNYTHKPPTGLIATPGNSLKHAGSGEEVDYIDTITWKSNY